MHFETIANNQSCNAVLRARIARHAGTRRIFSLQLTHPRHQDAHGELAMAHHTLSSQEQLARPANWDSMTRTARKHWKIKQAKHKMYLHK